MIFKLLVTLTFSCKSMVNTKCFCGSYPYVLHGIFDWQKIFVLKAVLTVKYHSVNVAC